MSDDFYSTPDSGHSNYDNDDHDNTGGDFNDDDYDVDYDYDGEYLRYRCFHLG